MTTNRIRQVDENHNYVWDVNSQSWVAETQSGAGGGSGGDATAANQATGNASLASIDSKLTNPLPVSAASLPLPSGASTEATLALIKAKTDNLDVALSTRTKPADAQHVIVDSSGTITVTGGLTDAQLRAVAVPVSGTFFQGTQPVSIATAPVLVTGSALIGKVGIDQTTDGTTNKVYVGNIPHVIVDTAPTTAVTQSGTWTVQPGNTANSTAWKVDGSAVTQPVSGTITANMGTVTADPFGANADAASATGSISAKLRFIASTGIPVTGTVSVTGTVTANAGTNLNTSLLALESGGNLATIAGKDFATQTTLALIKAKTDNLPAVGQAAMAASTPVVIASNQSAVPVSGTVAVTNANLDVALSTLATQATLALIKAKTDNLDVAASTLATSTKQDTGNTSLASIKTNTDTFVTAGGGGYVRQDSTATIAKETGGNLDALVTAFAQLLLSQGADLSTNKGPLIQGWVNDAPQSFRPDTLQPISLTTEGRLRVSTVVSDNGQLWQHTFDSPWSDDNQWDMESLYV